MIIVLDTNIWISLAINRQLEFVADLHQNGTVIASCETLLNELIAVLGRPKFQKTFTRSYIESFILFHQLATTSGKLTTIESVVSDEKDNYLFALCLVSKADYFITGDKLLLAVKNYNRTSVLSLAEFKAIIV
ncbi:MAG: putative toxin-antitoxin system toxin component, PIN family [Bacteroidota bacterium]|nr:putative toxin-antitoxin system toxin component, PIN family [Bacteroidota bacterium]